MNREAFDAAAERLREVNAVIETLNEAIRADAFAILRPYIDGKRPAQDKEVAEQGGGEAEAEAHEDLSGAEAFVRSQDIERPANAVKAIAAWWFSQYGSSPVKAENVTAIAAGIGVTIPARPYMTLKGMKSGGKDIFRSSHGAFIPTVPHGELFFKTEYSVEKGRRTPPQTARQ